MPRKHSEGTCWHILLDDDKRIREIVAPLLDYKSYEQIGLLLNTDRIRYKHYDFNGTTYFIYYDGNHAKVRELMVWKYDVLPDESERIADVDMGDMENVMEIVKSL